MGKLKVLLSFAELLNAKPLPVGIYGLPRGGTNFISAWLHYHPQVFCVSERQGDWRKPLIGYWRKKSIFREHGVQDKKPGNIHWMVFNKVQRFPEWWGPNLEYPGQTKFIFYIRNPIQIHISREAYRRKFDKDRDFWSDNRQNYKNVLLETKELIDHYQSMRERFDCILLAHEHFCLDHTRKIRTLYQYLGLEEIGKIGPDVFFKTCGACGEILEKRQQEENEILFCPNCSRDLEGFGRFNPLRKIDVSLVHDERWKRRQDVEELIEDARNIIGDKVIDYYLDGDFSINITL